MIGPSSWDSGERPMSAFAALAGTFALRRPTMWTIPNARVPARALIVEDTGRRRGCQAGGRNPRPVTGATNCQAAGTAASRPARIEGVAGQPSSTDRLTTFGIGGAGRYAC